MELMEWNLIHLWQPQLSFIGRQVSPICTFLNVSHGALMYLQCKHIRGNIRWSEQGDVVTHASFIAETGVRGLNQSGVSCQATVTKVLRQESRLWSVHCVPGWDAEEQAKTAVFDGLGCEWVGSTCPNSCCLDCIFKHQLIPIYCLCCLEHLRSLTETNLNWRSTY